MAEIQIVTQVRITNVRRESHVVEETSTLHVGDNPVFWAGEVAQLAQRHHNTVRSQVAHRFGDRDAQGRRIAPGVTHA